MSEPPVSLTSGAFVTGCVQRLPFRCDRRRPLESSLARETVSHIRCALQIWIDGSESLQSEIRQRVQHMSRCRQETVESDCEPSAGPKIFGTLHSAFHRLPCKSRLTRTAHRCHGFRSELWDQRPGWATDPFQVEPRRSEFIRSRYYEAPTEPERPRIATSRTGSDQGSEPAVRVCKMAADRPRRVPVPHLDPVLLGHVHRDR